MKLLTLCGLFALVISQKAHAKPATNADFHICYFSLNNEKEFHEAQKFTEKLNKVSPRKITVSEHLTENSEPQEAFRELVKSGQKCDGLVISGHHTGSFSGTRAQGNLELDFLENLSCEPEVAAWFRKINALWLQGCRTLGVGQIASHQQEVELFSADFHTQRLGNDRQRAEHGVGQGLDQINREFTATLDQDNPLSSRFLRIFPHAKVFGWTKTAPGIEAHSEYSVPYHMAHLVSLMRKDMPQDPIADRINAKDAADYANAMILTLGQIGNEYKYCEDLTVEAWKHHGQVYGPKKFSFDNRDLNAFPKLYSNADSLLLDVRKNECSLRLANSPESAKKAVQDLLSDRRHLPYVSNGLFAYIQKAEEEGNEDVVDVIRKEISQSKELLDFFRKKIASPQTGLLSKIDYYGHYHQFTGEDLPEQKKMISAAALKQVNTPTAPNDYDARDFKQSLFASLLKNGLFDFSKLQDVKSPEGLSQLAQALRTERSSIPEGKFGEVFDYVLKAPSADDSVLTELVSAAGNSYGKLKVNRSELFHDLIDREEAQAYTLMQLVRTININNGGPDSVVHDKKKFFEKAIDKLSKIPETDLPIAKRLLIYLHQIPVEGSPELVEKMVKKGLINNADTFEWLYQSGAIEIKDPKARVRIWKESLKSPHLKADSLILLAEGLVTLRGPEDFSEMVGAIKSAPQISPKVKATLQNVIRKSGFSEEQKKAFLDKVRH